MGNKLKISSGFFFLGSMALLVLPLRWVFGVFIAAMVHELFHCFAVIFCGGQVLSLSFGAFGAKIEATSMSAGREALCALAGPVGSFSMLLIARHFPEAALCGLIQGAYNLIPLYPMDGGRVLKFLLPEDLCFGIRIFTIVLISGLGVWMLPINPEMAMIVLLSIWIPVLQRKFSCKAHGLAVQ